MVFRPAEDESIAHFGASLCVALKEWAVTIRALREGRQVLLLRKGGILEPGGEFEVAARDVLLFPTYIHEDEQTGSIQPCYLSWMNEEILRRSPKESIRFESWGRITDVVPVCNFSSLYTLSSQHIYSNFFLKRRIETEPNKPLYALFVRAYTLERPVTVAMEADYYGCKSWIDLETPIAADERFPAMSESTYNERVRVTKRLISDVSADACAPTENGT